MQFLDNPLEYRPLIAEAIKNFGYAPEHNLEWFKFNAEKNEKPVFIQWPDGTGLMTLQADKEWYTFSEPLVPMKVAGQRVLEFAEAALSSRTEEVIVELSDVISNQATNDLRSSLDILPVDCTLVWPVVNLEKISGDLSGSDWKGIRNIRNKYYREYEIEMVDAQTIEKTELYRIINSWSEKRTGTDEVWPQTYLNLIDGKFAGTKNPKVLIVDQKPVALLAGWEIPNSKDPSFYNGVAIHDYSLRDLGLFMYAENILTVKKNGYKYFDLGGVESGGPLDFKKRFLPEYEYKTSIFSIIKK